MSSVQSPPALPTMVQVVRNDTYGYILGWMLGFVLVMPALLFVFAKLSDSPPGESWVEFAGGASLIALAGVALLRFRTEALRHRLLTSPRVTAELLRYIPGGQWASFRLRYRWEDRVLERVVLVPQGKDSSRLRDRSTLSLAVVPTNPRRIAIVDLFLPTGDP